MRALWLPQVLRAAGLTVHEVSGWKTRGADSWGPVRGITCHHTGGGRYSSIEGELYVLVNGREGLDGPIAPLMLARNGHWYVVASGHCNHNKVGWGGPNEGYGNDALLGIEAQHSGGDEPWTAVQYESYVRGVAALVRHKASGYDVTVSRVAGHKEHQPGDKSDPTFNMDTFRANVARKIADWGSGVSKQDVIDALKDPEGREAFGEALRWTVLDWPTSSMSLNNAMWLLHNRTAYLGNTAVPAMLTALDALSKATAALRAAVDADEASDVADRATILAELTAAEERLKAAIEAEPNETPPAEPTGM